MSVIKESKSLWDIVRDAEGRETSIPSQRREVIAAVVCCDGRVGDVPCGARYTTQVRGDEAYPAAQRRAVAEATAGAWRVQKRKHLCGRCAVGGA